MGRTVAGVWNVEFMKTKAGEVLCHLLCRRLAILRDVTGVNSNRQNEQKSDGDEKKQFTLANR